MRNLCLCLAGAGALASSSPAIVEAQTTSDDVSALVLRQDARFWTAYNTCETDGLDQYFTADVEFYHDKSGVTLGVAALEASIQQNLCSGRSKVRREPLPGTQRVFPLQNDADTYGAILSGEHLFFVADPGQPERQTGRARFTHLWLREDNVFKMARVLSYDHQDASSAASAGVTLSPAQLDRFTGQYQGPVSGTTTVTRDGDRLVLQGDTMRLLLYPATENTFFLADRDVTFEFHLQTGRPSKMVVRENGAVAEEVLAVR